MENGNYCHKIISMGKRKSTGGLGKHLRLKHSEVEVQEGKSTAKKSRNSTQDLIFRMAAMDGVSFRFLAGSSSLPQLCERAWSSIPTSSNTMRRMVLETVSKVRRDSREISKPCCPRVKGLVCPWMNGLPWRTDYTPVLICICQTRPTAWE